MPPSQPPPTGEITEIDGPTRPLGPVATSDRSDVVGTLEPERYEIRELIAQGGMGEVHLAWDRELQREVALKTLRIDLDDETLAQRFRVEARLSAQLEHPNIVPVHDYGIAPDGRPFITMRWIRGRSLWQLEDEGKLPGAVERLDIFRKLCDAIAFAHAQGVVHRDLKPSNVMVGEFGEVMVLDWGIARVAGVGSDAPSRSPSDRLSDELLASPLTGAGVVMGTPVYMAPELLTGRIFAVDPRIDVYALGVMLYKLLTDALPFTDSKALLDVRRAKFVPPRKRKPTIDRELDAIVCKAMAPDVAERYASADELRRDVQAYLEGGDVVAYPRSLVGRALRWARRNRRIVGPVVVTAVIATIALVVGGAFYARELAVSRDQALAAESDAQIQAARAETASALTSIEAGRYDDARVALARARVDVGDDDAFVELTEAYLLHEWAPPLLGWQRDQSGAVGVVLAPDGRRLLFATPEHQVHLVSLPDGFAEL
ncbi:MAG TPA: serine/threonine-protein kinase, partial [Nannocystaceae bacterium]|nr:serine/threonine-protein kinase [Nannocystaceae bacterium]